MNLKSNLELKFLSGIALLICMLSCTVHDAELPKHEYVTVYTDNIGYYDSLIYRKFEKEEHIHVRVKLLKREEILKQIKNEKYNCPADLILLNDFESLENAANEGLFRPIKSEILMQNVDPIYHSKNRKWFALSKTPLVVIYNKKNLVKDTLKNYFDLISPKWKGKIGFQSEDDATLNSFRRCIRLNLKEKSDSFLLDLRQQSILPFSGDDIRQIDRISKGEAQLAIVKLASLARQHKLAYAGKNNHLAVMPIFPNQRKKGCYVTISGAGVYRYCPNPDNAIKLLEFLSSNKAQYKYAAGRMHFPLIRDAKADNLLESYGKFRGRFYRKRNKTEKD